MTDTEPSKSASQLQDEMFKEIAKIDNRYLKLITSHENEIAKLKKAQGREKAQIEKKYLAMIEKLDEVDILLPEGQIERDNLGEY